MRIALFWYMIVSPFVEFPDPARVTPGGAKRGARLPSAEALHLRRLRRNLCGVLSEQDLEGNRNPQGSGSEAEERAAAGRRIGPEAVTEQKAGYRTADTLWTKVPICIPVKEVRRHPQNLRVRKTCTRRARIDEPVAWSRARDSSERHLKRQVG